MHMTEEVCLAFKECAALFGTVTDCIIFNVNMYYSIKRKVQSDVLKRRLFCVKSVRNVSNVYVTELEWLQKD